MAERDKPDTDYVSIIFVVIVIIVIIALFFLDLASQRTLLPSFSPITFKSGVPLDLFLSRRISEVLDKVNGQVVGSISELSQAETNLSFWKNLLWKFGISAAFISALGIRLNFARKSRSSRLYKNTLTIVLLLGLIFGAATPFLESQVSERRPAVLKAKQIVASRIRIENETRALVDKIDEVWQRTSSIDPKTVIICLTQAQSIETKLALQYAEEIRNETEKGVQ